MIASEAMIVVLIALALAIGLALPAMTMVRLGLRRDNAVLARRRQGQILASAVVAALLLVVVGLAPELRWETALCGVIALILCLVLIRIRRQSRERFIEMSLRLPRRALTDSPAEGATGHQPARSLLAKPNLRDDRGTMLVRTLGQDLRALVNSNVILVFIAISCFTGTMLPPHLMVVLLAAGGVIVLSSAFGSFLAWIRSSYGEVLQNLRNRLTIDEKDAFFGSEYFSYVGVFGGLIGIFCRLTQRAGILGQVDNQLAASLWTQPISLGLVGYFLILVFTGALRSESERWVMAGLALGLTVMLAMVQSRVGVVPMLLAYSVLVWFLAAGGMVVSNHLLQRDRVRWRAARGPLFLMPLALFLHHYLWTMNVNRSARPPLVDQFDYLCILALLFICGSVLITWLDTSNKQCFTEQTPTFNAMHNAVLVVGALAGGLLLSMQVLPARPDLNSLIGRTDPILVFGCLVVSIFGFSARNYREHLSQVPDAVLAFPAAEQEKWQRRLVVWSRAQVCLLASLAVGPWVIYILEVVL